jgi:hypothetical protein
MITEALVNLRCNAIKISPASGSDLPSTIIEVLVCVSVEGTPHTLWDQVLPPLTL